MALPDFCAGRFSHAYEPPLKDAGEIWLCIDGIIDQLKREQDNLALSAEMKKATETALSRIRSILLHLAGHEQPKLPESFNLQPADPSQHIDQLDILKLLAANPKAKQSELILLLEHLLKIAYNQVQTSPQNPTQMDWQSLEDYLHIAPQIFGQAEGEKIYTDTEVAKQLLKEILGKLYEKPSQKSFAIAGVGAGHTELAALRELGAVQVLATDLLPAAMLGENSLTRQMARAGRIELIEQADIAEVMRLIVEDQELYDKYGNPLKEAELDCILSLGSSLVNHRGFHFITSFFYYANQALKMGGHLVLELQDFEVLPDQNAMRQQVLQFGKQHPEMPYGAKGVNPKFQHKNNAPDGFGAWLHSHATLRGLAAAAGFEIVSVTQRDPQLALDHLQNPQIANSDPLINPTWRPEEGVLRTFYVLKKIDKPQPIMRLLLKSFLQGFAHRLAPATSPPADAIPTASFAPAQDARLATMQIAPW
jgi:hypothetical protein